MTAVRQPPSGQHSRNAATESSPPAQFVEQGKFRLHKFERAIGEESYQIQQSGSTLEAGTEG